ncbi:UDP-N-acetylmuramoyl-L-alanine--D-glutamate ligase [Candidatus Daviesbacteria bacterium]|nr:UDP-N-acetylmuramoyl-L-alanine--D-glutamate ligase [Candidatus Daviesbacteria bacterium]
MNNKFKNKKVLIFGLGLNQGGVGSAQFFANEGSIVKVTDLKSKEILKPSLKQLKEFRNISYTLGKHKYEDINWADIIIRNPAIKDNNQYLKYALNKGKRVETDFSIFLDFANQKKIIAITGTKGKSTTASLIYEAIKESGKKVIFAGNIGKSILNTLPYLSENPWIVVEISSFQLQSLKEKIFTPKIAVITNIYPDHLNWHTSMEEYIQAKKMVAINQTAEDFLVIPCSGGFFNKEFLQGIKSKLVDFCTSCDRDISKLLEETKLPLAGTANKENYAAAFSVCDILGIDRKTVIKAFKKFKGSEFRMQLLGTFGGVGIFNDSTATNPIATMAALQTLGSFNIILITGGMNKGMDYTKYATAVSKSVKKVFFLEGDATEEIKKYLNQDLIADTYNNLEKLLIDVKKEARSGSVILFSPAATSFNLFQNEFDRGRKFNEAVRKVFRNA